MIYLKTVENGSEFEYRFSLKECYEFGAISELETMEVMELQYNSVRDLAVLCEADACPGSLFPSMFLTCLLNIINAVARHQPEGRNEDFCAEVYGGDWQYIYTIDASAGPWQVFQAKCSDPVLTELYWAEILGKEKGTGIEPLSSSFAPKSAQQKATEETDDYWEWRIAADAVDKLFGR